MESVTAVEAFWWGIGIGTLAGGCLVAVASFNAGCFVGWLATRRRTREQGEGDTIQEVDGPRPVGQPMTDAQVKGWVKGAMQPSQAEVKPLPRTKVTDWTAPAPPIFPPDER